MNKINRNQFLKTIGLSSFMLGTGTLLAQTSEQNELQLDKKLIEEFVRLGHKDLDKVKAMLAEHPGLLNAAHDWQHGDFETCLGAASHVGHKAMASWLIEQGAQANIFTAALFGRMEIIKPMLDFFPQALHAKGPHGFTLLHHANKGGAEALAVKEYLESLGAKETRVEIY